MIDFISYSKCDVCGWDGHGVANTTREGTIALFECLLCTPERFEEIHLENKKRKSRLPQDEKSPII